MGLRINTNVQSLLAQHKLDHNRVSLEHTQNKLSSGSRIVRAMDDAAGLAISESLRATERATVQNITNAQNGVLMLETAEGALNQVTNIVIRMKELATAAASDTNGDRERSYLDGEYQQLKEELDRIALSTRFNGRPLLNGEGGEIGIQVGPNNDESIDRILVNLNYVINLDALGLGGLEIGSAEGARESLDPIHEALTVIAGVRGSIGASESRLNSTIQNLMQYEENVASSRSRIRDADLAYETAELAKFNILTQAGVAVLAQANATPQLALKLLG